MSRPAPSDDWVAALVHDAVAAPSMHNVQPWRFRYLRQSRAFEVWADFERAMPHSDPDTRILHLGCGGASLLNLRPPSSTRAGTLNPATARPHRPSTPREGTVGRPYER